MIDVDFLPPFSDGLCREIDPIVFFPDNRSGVAAAQKACSLCPRKSECRAWVIELETRLGERQSGVWGGLAAAARPNPKPVLCKSRRHRRDEFGEITASGDWRCKACREEAQARSDAKKIAARSAARKQAPVESGGYSWMDEVDAPWAS